MKNSPSADRHYNQGNLLNRQGKPAEAVPCYLQALREEPGHLGALNNLGNTYSLLGQPEKALACFVTLLELVPGDAAVHYNMARALEGLGRRGKAIEQLRLALDLEPDRPEAHNNLGCLLTAEGTLGEALDEFRQALRLAPENAEAFNNLGNALVLQADPAAAIPAFQSALQVSPRFLPAFSNLLMALNYSDTFAPEAIYAAHLAYGEMLEKETAPLAAPEPVSLPEGRPIRIGYVSPDFRAHSVAFFLLPLLRNHDRSRFEIFCYASVEKPDETTREIRELADHWRDVTAMTDVEAAAAIGEDRVDVLVDLAGHSAGNRLPVFVHRPAPVQVTWLGYPNTTGLSSMDFRITDAIADPPETTESLHRETLLRLPTPFLCYEPPCSTPPVNDLPALEQGHVTFGCFNNPAKFSPTAIRLWAEVLKEVPGSRLILKHKSLADGGAREHFYRLFRENGIEADRLELLSALPTTHAHLEAYHRIDLALDTYPYHGTTTTCEALWMGVPVVSLQGRVHAGRVGGSILAAVDLPQLAAATPEEFVATAVRLATDLEELSRLRHGLRERISRSPLMDGKGFAAAMETVLAAILAQRIKAAAPDRPGSAVPAMEADILLRHATVLTGKGLTDEAITWLLQGLPRHPCDAAIHCRLGALLRHEQRAEEAKFHLRLAIYLDPEQVEALSTLAEMLLQEGDSAEAERYLRRLVGKVRHPQPLFLLANLCCDSGKVTEAEELYRQALALEPGFTQARNNLGTLCRQQGRLEEAAELYRQVLDEDAQYLTAQLNLGIVLRLLLRFQDAATLFREIIAAHPDCAAAHFNLGNTLLAMGDAEGAAVAYGESLALEPGNMDAHDNLLMAMAFSTTVDADSLYREHLRFAAKFALPLKNEIRRPDNLPDPARPLKIGYVSPDFRLHAVAYFIEPVLANHDRGQFQIYCYANIETPDAVTDHIRSLAPHWRDIYRMPDAEVAELVRRDGIDILVDLAGHTSGQRLLVFARKPAPIQVEFIGYPNTSGLDTMDFLITDEITSPEGLGQLFSEIPLRLPETRYCFNPLIATPEVGSLPLTKNGYPTLGCFNNVAKINKRVVALWSKLLLTMPDCRLLLKSRLFDDERSAVSFRERFTRTGIDPERIVLLGHSSHLDTLAEYGSVDIALDTFPFPGGTTTCEALWMGVPVVAMGGRTFPGRQAASLLVNVGHSEWVAEDETAYLRIVGELAGDREKLAQIRSTLRQQMKASPLMDALRFTKLLEDAYRRMWRDWCEGQA